MTFLIIYLFSPSREDGWIFALFEEYAFVLPCYKYGNPRLFLGYTSRRACVQDSSHWRSTEVKESLD